MTRKYKRWTSEENDVLVQLVSKYPHNLHKAFEEASVELDRTVNSCTYHWYSVLSPANDTTKTGVAFMSISNNTVCKNRKVSKNPTVSCEKNTLWSKIKRLFRIK